MSRLYTKEELNKIIDLIDEALHHASGVTSIDDRFKVDIANMEVGEIQKEIDRLKNQIQTNMNAFAVPKLKVKKNV